MRQLLKSMVFFFLLLGCLSSYANSPSNAANQFTIKLFKALPTTTHNQVASPYSAFNVFATLYPGAAGKTKQQIAKLFHFPCCDKSFYQAILATNQQLAQQLNKTGNALNIANGIWVQSGFKLKSTYLHTVEEQQATLQRIDFNKSKQAALTINQWVAKQTKQFIKKLVSPSNFSKETRLALLNAIYFHANWAKPFQKLKTNEHGIFYITPNSRLTAAMMSQAAVFPYLANKEFQLISLPYTSKNISMIILLPRSTVKLETIIQQLQLKQLNQWISKLKPTMLQLELPRFSFDSRLPLTNTLKKLGLTTAFNQQANFSALSKEPLLISTVLQKAIIRVNEKGTTAAAATAAIMNTFAMIHPQVSFKANRPFLFLIRDNQSGLILFIGTLHSPHWSK